MSKDFYKENYKVRKTYLKTDISNLKSLKSCLAVEQCLVLRTFLLVTGAFLLQPCDNNFLSEKCNLPCQDKILGCVKFTLVSLIPKKCKVLDFVLNTTKMNIWVFCCFYTKTHNFCAWIEITNSKITKKVFHPIHFFREICTTHRELNSVLGIKNGNRARKF